MITESYYRKKPLLTGISFITTNEIASIFELLGNAYPSGFNARRDIDTGEMKWALPPRKEAAA